MLHEFAWMEQTSEGRRGTQVALTGGVQLRLLSVYQDAVTGAIRQNHSLLFGG